jgi:hypothetical protein
VTVPLYVEARIRAGMDQLWEATQDPAQHRRWDLRFTHIDYLGPGAGGAQRFRYGVRVLGVMLSGTGVCAGERRGPDGGRASALRFASPHPLSLLAEGSGYWRYVPTPQGIRFLTGYDYQPRWGWFGRFADRLAFRPLMGWATAWSFDRLRLWLERGIPPERLLRQAVADFALRAAAVIATAALAPYSIALCVTAGALLLPPSPATPAARRCLRRRPARVTAPALLDRLETLR